MPYTPPSQRSPASSNGSSPNLSRSHSYSHDQGVSSPIYSSKPALPRSHSSASALQKHRRTASVSQVNGIYNATLASRTQQPERPSSSDGKTVTIDLQEKRLTWPGVVSTPPDSQQGSDDDERARQLGDLTELHVALSSINQKREPSPTGDGRQSNSSAKLEVPSTTPALTAEARKISHSRSSSEIMLSKHVQPVHESPIQASDDSSEDDSLQIKPPLLRKKSGELVKPALRPVSRRRPSSMPGTPTYSKAVHFNDDIEQVRHFLQVDRPIAVSAGSSPVETYDSESEYPFGGAGSARARRVEWELRLSNFPKESYERQSKPVRVERIFLSTDSQTLIGTVAVANLAFQKTVVVRFTLDYWKTVSEITAEYTNDVRKKQVNDGYDRFNFTIKLSDQVNLEKKTLLLCVRYNVNGQEFWDNNENMNYQVDFIKKTKPKVVKPMVKPGLHSGSLGVIPRSRHSPPVPRPRSMPPAIDDDFGAGFDSDFKFGSSQAFLSDSPNSTIKLKKKPTPSNTFTNSTHRSGAAQAFSTRYDFSASLSAALSSAQTVLGDRSGLPTNAPDQSPPQEEPRKTSNTASKEKPTPSSPAPATTPPGTRPDAISSGKPDLQSAEYNELIQKYCFVRAPRAGVA
jgi:hypothetical protein